MPNYVARNVTVIDFSDLRNIQIPEVYQPQSCIIKMSDHNFDIGSYCYADQKLDKNGYVTTPKKNSQGINVRKVVMGSLDEKRFAFIRKWIEYASYLAETNSARTLKNALNSIGPFLQFYFSQLDLDYCDPENRLHYEEAARRYSASIKADVRKGIRTKSVLTSGVFSFAEFLYDEVDLNAFDYDIIPNVDQVQRGTTPLLAEDLDNALALRTAIFEGVYDLLINNKPLPHAITVPKVCGELNDRIWLGYNPFFGGAYNFPRAKDFEKNQPKEWFDRAAGLLVPKTQWRATGGHRGNIIRNLKRTNADHSKLKQALAKYASVCFLDLLMSMNGANQQSLLDLPWYGGYFVQKAKQGKKTITLLKPEDQSELEQSEEASVYLRSIKNRRGYGPVEVEINNNFLRQFKRYLQLREYYLNGSSNARLFPLSAENAQSVRGVIHTAFPEIPKLGAQKARATLSDDILTTTNDPYVAARILQNDVKTVIKHYAAGTQKAQIQGVGGFFNELGNQIKTTQIATENEIETAAGGCSNKGARPDPLPDAPIEPNCTQQVGCFFCKHYCVHADETDIRKLTSILYYINRGATRAQNVDFFNELYSLVITRIKELLADIEAISPQKKSLVARVKEEVFDKEELDDYWLAKLNRVEIMWGAR
jgi:hypothetical protein